MVYRVSVIIVLVIAVSLWSTGVAFAADLTEGLVGYWPLDGNGKDESGNGKDARIRKGREMV